MKIVKWIVQGFLAVSFLLGAGCRLVTKNHYQIAS